MRVAAPLILIVLATSMTTSAAPLKYKITGSGGLSRSSSMSSTGSSASVHDDFHTPVGSPPGSPLSSNRWAPPGGAPSPDRITAASPDRITQASSSGPNFRGAGSASFNGRPAAPAAPPAAKGAKAAPKKEEAKEEEKPEKEELTRKQKVKNLGAKMALVGTGMFITGLALNADTALINHDMAVKNETSSRRRSPMPEPMPLRMPTAMGMKLQIPGRKPQEPMHIQTASERWGTAPPASSRPVPPGSPGSTTSRVDHPKTEEELKKEKEEEEKKTKVPLVTKISFATKTVGLFGSAGFLGVTGVNHMVAQEKEKKADKKKAAEEAAAAQNGTSATTRRSEYLYVSVPVPVHEGGDNVKYDTLRGLGPAQVERQAKRGEEHIFVPEPIHENIDENTLRGLGPQQVKPKEPRDTDPGRRSYEVGSASPHVYSRQASAAQQIIREVQMHELGYERPTVYGVHETDERAEVRHAT